MTYLHHFVIVNADVDRPEGVTQLLNLQGVAADGPVPLLIVVQLLTEFKLPCGRVCREYVFEVHPRFFQRFGLSDIA